MLIDDDGISSMDILEDSLEDIERDKVNISHKICCFCKRARKKHNNREVKLHVVDKLKTLDDFEKTARDLG